jgi:hypothetical protein
MTAVLLGRLADGAVLVDWLLLPHRPVAGRQACRQRRTAEQKAPAGCFTFHDVCLRLKAAKTETGMVIL